MTAEARPFVSFRTDQRDPDLCFDIVHFATLDEAIAHAGGVGDLVDGQKERSAERGMCAQRLTHIAHLPQVEPIKRLIDEQRILRRQKADGEQRAPGFAIDLADGSSAQMTFNAQTYPGLLALLAANPNLLDDNGEENINLAFRFHVLATATPMTPDEFVAMESADAR